MTQISRRKFLTGLAALAVGTGILGCTRKLPKAIEQDPVLNLAYTNPEAYRNKLSNIEKENYDQFNPDVISEIELKEINKETGLNIRYDNNYTENEKAVLWLYKELKKGINIGPLNLY